MKKDNISDQNQQYPKQNSLPQWAEVPTKVTLRITFIKPDSQLLVFFTMIKNHA